MNTTALTTTELTQTVYKAEVTAFLEWAGKPAQDVHIGDVVGYKQALSDKGLAPASTAKKLSAFRSSTKSAMPRGSRPPTRQRKSSKA